MWHPFCQCGNPECLNKAISHNGDTGSLAAAADGVCWHGNSTEAQRQAHTQRQTDESFQLSVNKVNVGCKVPGNVQTQALLPREDISQSEMIRATAPAFQHTLTLQSSFMNIKYEPKTLD